MYLVTTDLSTLERLNILEKQQIFIMTFSAASRQHISLEANSITLAGKHDRCIFMAFYTVYRARRNDQGWLDSISNYRVWLE